MTSHDGAHAMGTAQKPWWQRWWVIALGVLVLLAIIGNLLPNDGDEAATTPTPTRTSAAAASTVAAQQSSEVAPATSEAAPVTSEATGPECVTVSREVADHVAGAIDETATAAQVGAVKAGESWVVAVVLKGSDFDGERAIFETLNVESPTLLKGVDGLAHEATNLPESAFSVADQPAEDAVACLAPVA